FFGKTLDFEAVVLDLNKVPIAKDAVEPRGDFTRLFDLGIKTGEGTDRFLSRPAAICQESAAEFAADAAAEANDAFAEFGQQLSIDARFVIEAFKESPARHFHQVAEAGAVLRQERQVIARLLTSGGATLFEATSRRDIGFVAQDGIDACGLACFV